MEWSFSIKDIDIIWIRVRWCLLDIGLFDYNIILTIGKYK